MSTDRTVFDHGVESDLLKLQKSMSIDRPLDVVFYFLADFENASKWQRGVVEAKKLTEGPTGQGTKFKETFQIRKKSFSAICTITAFEPNHKVAFEAKSDGPMEYGGVFSFEGEGTGTKLRFDGGVRLKGIYRLLGLFMKAEIEKEMVEEMKKIKDALEGRQKGI